jgi:hypothetical protein
VTSLTSEKYGWSGLSREPTSHRRPVIDPAATVAAAAVGASGGVAVGCSDRRSVAWATVGKGGPAGWRRITNLLSVEGKSIIRSKRAVANGAPLARAAAEFGTSLTTAALLCLQEHQWQQRSASPA